MHIQRLKGRILAAGSALTKRYSDFQPLNTIIKQSFFDFICVPGFPLHHALVM